MYTPNPKSFILKHYVGSLICVTPVLQGGPQRPGYSWLPRQPALGGEGGGGSMVVPINMLVCDCGSLLVA